MPQKDNHTNTRRYIWTRITVWWHQIPSSAAIQIGAASYVRGVAYIFVKSRMSQFVGRMTEGKSINKHNRVAMSQFFRSCRLSTHFESRIDSWIDSFSQLFSAILFTRLDENLLDYNRFTNPNLLNYLLSGINHVIQSNLGLNWFPPKKSCQFTIILKKGQLNRLFNSWIVATLKYTETRRYFFPWHQWTKILTSRPSWPGTRSFSDHFHLVIIS